MFVLVVGGGKVGAYLTRLLLDDKHRVRLVEVREEQIASLEADLPPEVIVRGNGTDPSVLEAAGIRQANALAAVTGDDEVNLVIATLARFEFSIPRIIARVNNPKNAWMYTPEMGVDVGLNQAELIGRLIAEEMSLGDMMTLMKLRKGQYSLVEEKVHPESVAANKPVKDLRLPDMCVLLAILRRTGIVTPKGETILEPADEVLALVHQSQLAPFNALLSRRP
jgi:trk system potassium uptake protein TrkA